jgi:hypothetical protein
MVSRGFGLFEKFLRKKLKEADSVWAMDGAALGFEGGFGV